MPTSCRSICPETELSSGRIVRIVSRLVKSNLQQSDSKVAAKKMANNSNSIRDSSHDIARLIPGFINYINDIAREQEMVQLFR